MGKVNPFTQDELAEIEKLAALGATQKEIGAKLNRSSSGVGLVMLKNNWGVRTKKRSAEEVYEKVSSLFAQGVSDREISQTLSLNLHYVYEVRRKLGLYRKERTLPETNQDGHKMAPELTGLRRKLLTEKWV